jgi:hypothetical protein
MYSHSSTLSFYSLQHLEQLKNSLEYDTQRVPQTFDPNMLFVYQSFSSPKTRLAITSEMAMLESSFMLSASPNNFEWKKENYFLH